MQMGFYNRLPVIVIKQTAYAGNQATVYISSILPYEETATV